MAPPASVSFPMCFSRSTGGVGVSTGTLREFLLAWRAGADKTPSPPPLGYALRWRRSETRVLIIELLEDSRAGGGQPAPTWRLYATGKFFCALLSLPSQISPAKGRQEHCPPEAAVAFNWPPQSPTLDSALAMVASASGAMIL